MTKRKPYKREMKATWWLENPFFIRYIIREGSSFFVMAFSLEVFYAFYAIASTEHAWMSFVNWLSSPYSILFHSLCLIAALIHSLTWFSLAPKTMDLWIKNKKLDDKLITTAHYLAFVVASLGLTLIIGAWL